jgi:monofunctional biosynthetic peptidoglycan transglycosylase
MIHLDPISALRRARRVIASLGGGEAARLASLARPYFKPGAAAARLARLFIRAVIACHAAFFIIMAFACLLLSRWNPPVTALMIYRGFTGGSLAKPLAFIPLRQIPKETRQMLVRLEDMHFYTHHGIDLGAIRDAYRVNKAIGYVYAGASTIPQQLARTLFLSPRKTYFRKYVEALISIEMDFFLSKDRILELYLNYIEWGSGVFGIGAASSFYYQTKPAHLTLDEQRRLAAILTNPLRYNVSTFTKSRQMAGRYQYLLDKFPDPVPESGQAAQPGQEGQPGQETGQAQPEGAAAPPQNAPGIQRDGTPAPRG